ncbi:hypothetical protein Nmel_009924 [Mimus melanotis]
MVGHLSCHFEKEMSWRSLM